MARSVPRIYSTSWRGSWRGVDRAELRPVSAPEQLLLVLHVLDALAEVLEFGDDLAGVLELVILAGEADVGDLVEVAQALHDLLADGAGRDFPLVLAVERLFDFVHELDLGFLGDGALAAGA